MSASACLQILRSCLKELRKAFLVSASACMQFFSVSPFACIHISLRSFCLYANFSVSACAFMGLLHSVDAEGLLISRPDFHH